MRAFRLRQLLFAWPSARDATAAAVPGSRKLACCPRTPAIPQPCRREYPLAKPPASATKHHLSSRLPPPLPTPRHQPPSHALSVSSSPGTSRNNHAIPPPWRWDGVVISQI